MADTGHPRRWFILGILNLSLVLVVASVSSLNLSLPSIQRSLDASAADLIWINAAYALVFAAFLLPAGALGDRFGRKGALLTGRVVFVLGSLLGSTGDTAGQVIAFRATMEPKVSRNGTKTEPKWKPKGCLFSTPGFSRKKGTRL